jgi:hypothetical protein
MDESTVEAAGVVTIRKGTGAPLAAAVTYDPATKKAVLNPNANLKRGAKYKAVVTPGRRTWRATGSTRTRPLGRPAQAVVLHGEELEAAC